MMKTLALLLLAALTLQAAPASVDNVLPLSPKAKAIYNHVYQTVRNSPAESGVPADSLLASGRIVTDVANYGTIPEHCEKIFYPGIVNAQEEVLITTFLFDKSSECGKLAHKALVDLNKRLQGTGKKVRVYFLISTMSQLAFWLKGGFKLPRLSDVFNSLSETKPSQFYFPEKEDLPNLDFRIKTFHKWALGTIHNKLFIVDGKTLITGSKNWDTLPGFEYLSRIEGTIAATARLDFIRMWQEPIPKVSTLATQPKAGEYPILYLSRVSNPSFSHPEDNPQDQGWLKALDVATKSVYIQSPNFISQPIVDKVLETVRRGVKVTVITSYLFHDFVSYFNSKSAGNNRHTIRNMYLSLLKEPKATNNLEMCYFMGHRVKYPIKGEFAHVKFMAVDEEFVIFGSGNQDTQSWYNSSESNFLLDNPQETKRMLNRLLEPQQSLKNCYRDLYGEKPASDPTWMDEPEPSQDEPPIWMQ